ncbi:hypothetical protein, partial [Xanthomonas translucens]|uniref:hypothetical protein n=3 Tax=Xanthomonas campestris pv. translucens TaxID=343 RepID=UPI001E3D5720
RATSSLPTLVKFERTLVQLFGLGNEVDVRPPWLLHVLEHCGLSACRTSLSTQTLEQPPDTSGFSRDIGLSGEDLSRLKPLLQKRAMFSTRTKTKPGARPGFA